VAKYNEGLRPEPAAGYWDRAPGGGSWGRSPLKLRAVKLLSTHKRHWNLPILGNVCSVGWTVFW